MSHAIEHLDLREQVITTACRLNSSGLSTGTSGNVSVRVPGKDALLITPSGKTYQTLKPEDICLLYFDGKKEGHLKESIEKDIHLEIMRAFPTAHAVVHCDAFYARIVQGGIPLYIHQMQEMGGYIPNTPYFTPGTPQLAHSVVNTMRFHKSPITIMKKHGLAAWGRDLNAAFALAQKGENFAHGWILYQTSRAAYGKKPELIEGQDELDLEDAYKHYSQHK